MTLITSKDVTEVTPTTFSVEACEVFGASVPLSLRTDLGNSLAFQLKARERTGEDGEITAWIYRQPGTNFVLTVLND